MASSVRKCDGQLWLGGNERRCMARGFFGSDRAINLIRLARRLCEETDLTWPGRGEVERDVYLREGLGTKCLGILNAGSSGI